MYYFSRFAVELNEEEEGVAPTDSRLRPDQRLMEIGNWDDANDEKIRLEVSWVVGSGNRSGLILICDESRTLGRLV